MSLFSSNQKVKYCRWKLEQKKRKSAIKIETNAECARRKWAIKKSKWGHGHPKR